MFLILKFFTLLLQSVKKNFKKNHRLYKKNTYFCIGFNNF
jgi:hypothetical protein